MRKLDLSTNTLSQTSNQSSNNQQSNIAAENQPAFHNSQAQTTVDSQPPLKDNQPVLKQSGDDMKKMFKKIIPLLLIAVVAGVATGFGAHRLTAKDTGVPASGNLPKVAGPEVSNGDVFGSADEKTFKDSATGYLETGGLDGEGSHKLLRPGGEAQTVYLTSSVTDLDKLVGMEVQVWGETFKGQKAGWLMDVGRIKVVEVEGVSPIIE